MITGINTSVIVANKSFYYKLIVIVTTRTELI